MNKNFLAVIPFLFMSYGYSQSLIDCDTKGYYCKAFKPACFHEPRRIYCSHNGKEIKGFVPVNTPVKYLKFKITAPDGNTKEVKLQVRGTVADFADVRPSDFYDRLYFDRHITQQGSRVELAENGFGIETSAKFSEHVNGLFANRDGMSQELSRAAKSLAEYLKGNPPDSASNIRCNYSTAPSIIKVVCDENCPRRNCGTKEVCVGSAKCLINAREFKIHNVYCAAAPARSPDFNTRCRSAIDCIADKSIKAIKLDSKRFDALDHYDDGQTYREGGAGGAGAVQ